MDILFKPTTLKNLTLKNKFIRSATWEGLCKDGFPTPQLFSLYKKLVEGDVGLIITGYTAVSKNSHSNIGQMAIYNDDFIPHLKKLNDFIHSINGKIAIQLVHCGGQAVIPVAPSAINFPELYYRGIPKELTKDEIKNIINDFIKAAIRAIKANFDAIQIHAAHGFLISQFLSKKTNKRTDEYGGDIHSRAKILYEIIKGIKSNIDKKPLTVKINCSDFYKDGLSLKESIEIIKQLEQLKVDAVEISGGTRASGKFSPVRNTVEEAYYKNEIKIIKKYIKLPIILVGGLRSIDTIYELFNKNLADFFAFSRPLINNPYLIKHFKEKTLIKSNCQSCNKCFIPAKKGFGIKCIFDKNQK